MAMDKHFKRLETKIDRLLDERGIDYSDLATPEATARPPRELTPQEQDAIDNAPKAEASVPPAERGPRVTAQNAPDTSSSVPKDAVEKQLEAETGHDVVQTGTKPPTFVETDKPASSKSKSK